MAIVVETTPRGWSVIATGPNYSAISAEFNKAKRAGKVVSVVYP